MSKSENTTSPSKPVVPPNAPPRPENPILKHEAWAPMWVEDNNVLWTFVGDTGDGKSYAMLRAAEKIDPDFSIDQVAFDIVEFLQLVMDDSYGRGTVIALEEASVEADAIDWHSVSNKVFRKVLDTWRHQNRMGMITLPSFMALDKGARRRTAAIIEMLEAKEYKGYSEGKFKRARYNNIDDRFTTPFPTLEGRKRKWIRFKKPSPDLREAYEKRKADYTQELNESLLQELLAEKDEGEGDTGPETPREIADDIISDSRIEEYIADNHGQRYISRDKIALHYEIGDRKSKKVKTALLEEVDDDVM